MLYAIHVLCFQLPTATKQKSLNLFTHAAVFNQNSAEQ